MFTFQSCDVNPTSQSLYTNFSASRGVESRSASRCRITSARSVRSVNDLNAVKKLRILRILSLAAIWPTKEKSRRGIPRFTVWNGGKPPGTKLSRPACTRAAEGRVRGNESKENFVRVMIHTVRKTDWEICWFMIELSRNVDFFLLLSFRWMMNKLWCRFFPLSFVIFFCYNSFLNDTWVWLQSKWF